MIDPKKELFKWGPIDGRLIYVDSFVEAFVDYPNHIDGSWPDTFGFLKDDRMVFIADYADLRNNGEHLFRKYILKDKELKKAYKEWSRVIEKFRDFERFVNRGLSKTSDKEFAEKIMQWNRIYVDFWIKGFLPELSNWGGEQLLKRKILESDRKNFIEIFEKLSAPEKLSFFQKEGLEFMRIKLMKDRKKQEKMLESHQKKYYWLRNDYGFTRVLDIAHFKDELKKISEKDAKKKIKEIQGYAAKVKKEKKKIIKKYKISKEISKIAGRLAYCVWWQDYRKSFIFIGNHITSEFLKEIGKRKKIDFKELCYYLIKEIDELVKEGKKIDAKQRFNGFVEYYHERGRIDYITGKQAEDFARPYLDIRIDPNQKEIKGMVVSSGKTVRGAVKILATPKEISKMNYGDILVASMTSPDFIVAMRKASAIITDEGGMTCHAAIVSRELGIPCIVQTRIATRLLKDGEIVEVDTGKGIVRRIR